MANILIQGMDMPGENDGPILAWICSDGDVIFFQDPIKFPNGETTGTAYGAKAKAIQLTPDSRLVDLDAAHRNIPMSAGGLTTATKDELFAAVRLIKEHCASMAENACRDCPFRLTICDRCFVDIPYEWPDPEEGSGENGI